MTSYRGFSLWHIAVRLCAAVLGLIMAGAASLASASDAPGNSAFLALGDSVVFGYIAADGYAYVNPRNFVGYPEYVGGDLRLDTANAACPGETTSSFISLTGDDNGCRPYRASFPLHASYTSTQLDFATRFLATHKQTRLVTITLGANDGFLLQYRCAINPGPGLTPEQCVLAGIPALQTLIRSNMTAILRSLRATGYRGILMVVNYYSVNYQDAAQTGLVVLLNQTLASVAAANSAVVADVFTAFQSAATPAAGQTCMVGLLNVNPSATTALPPAATCDDHPSQSGQQLLADTIVATYQATHAGGKDD